jgi:hypothetical protein
MKLPIRLIAALILVAATTLVSCDNDLNSLGNGLVGIDPNATILQQEFDVTTFSSNVNPVQTDNFNSYLLGTYNDPVYGRSDYSIVSQLVPSFLTPDFDQDEDPATLPVLKSVFIELPYFSTATGVDGEATTYRIDSIYGSGFSDLKIYRNKFLLNDFDPSNPSLSATYFSDFGNSVRAVSTGMDADLIYENNNFVPSDAQVIILNEDGDVIERKSPRLRIPLNSTEQLAYWSDILFDSDPDDFRSNSNFKDFFRGLFITMTPVGSDPGTLIYLNLSEAAVIFSIESPIEGLPEPILSGYRFDFNSAAANSIQANFIETDVSPGISTAIVNSFNEDIGSENIYLKGGPGAMGFIDLFGADNDGDGEADALTQIIADQWLVNDAILELFVDQSVVTGGKSEPERIIIYNFETGRVLLDFAIGSQGTLPNSNQDHLGRLERVELDDTNSDGVKYRLRLTNHVNAIINGIVENDRLAVAVTQNVGLFNNSLVKDQTSPIEINTVTEGSAISHEGTVLHGNLSTEVDKRPKFTIFYSEPTN